MGQAIRVGEFRRIGSVLIARHGRLAYESYFEGDAATLRDTRSATKTITGMLIGAAIERHALPGVETPVVPFFPELQPLANSDPRKDRMTVEALLSMRSPLDCDDWVDASPGNEERMYPTERWIKFALDLPVRADTAASAPFHYCTAGVVALGGVLAKATGKPVDRFADEVLFAPLGIETVRWNSSPSGEAMTGGGLQLRSRDLLKLGQLYLGGGMWNGRRVLSAAWVAESVRPRVAIGQTPDAAYGYLWWLQSFVPKGGTAAVAAYFMSGNGGNKVFVLPVLDAVVVLTSTNYNTRGMHAQAERLLTDFVLPALH